MNDEHRYAALSEVLEELGAHHGADSAHGILAGMLSGGAAERSRWIAEVLDNTTPRGEAAKRCLMMLAELFDETRMAMDDAELAFHPLLPDDDADLVARATALGHWCEGFLLGLGLAGRTSDEALPAEAREVVGDLAEIARIDPRAAADEDDEASYAELAEYARVGALLVREHLAAATPVAKGGGPSTTKH